MHALAVRRNAIGDTPGALIALRKCQQLNPDQREERIDRFMEVLEKKLIADPRIPMVIGPGVTKGEYVGRLTALYERLDEYAQKKVMPRDADEALKLARLAALFAHRRVLSTRLFADAFGREKSWPMIRPPRTDSSPR